MGAAARAVARPRAECGQAYAGRNVATEQACRSGGHTMREMAEHFGVHDTTVSRAVRKHGLAMLEC